MMFRNSKEASKNRRYARDEVVGNFLISMLPYAVESWNFTPIENVDRLIKGENFEKTEDEAYQNIFIKTNASRSSEVRKTFSSNIAYTVDHFSPQPTSFSELSFTFADHSTQTSKSLIAELEGKYTDDSISSAEDSQNNSYGCFIKFRNGNSYIGKFSGIHFDGYGIYRWSNGTSYEGTFQDNEIIGEGIMIWPDLSWYKGEFYHGYRHGIGTFYLVFSSTFYHGEWRWGERHGKGFLLYSKNEFYDGEWYRNYRDGNGELSYLNGCHYYGKWSLDQRNGFGIFCWPNNDCYKGNWLNGEMEDYGEYIWNAAQNNNFCFAIENVYCGTWKKGLRDGLGKLEFGFINCARYEGEFKLNLKHGDGRIICGNGRIIDGKPLFLFDKPIHLTNDNIFTKINDIPIHMPMYQIDFTYHLKRAYKQLFPHPKARKIIHNNLEQHKLECFEKTIKQNLLILWKIYTYYSSTLGAIRVTKRPCIMIRLGLWQFYRDCNIIKKISLVKIDNLLYSCDNILLETIHNPFERIYFWQFLHSLFSVAWSLYSNSFKKDEQVPDCIAFTFYRLLDLDIYPNAFQNNDEKLSTHFAKPLSNTERFHEHCNDGRIFFQMLQTLDVRDLIEIMKHVCPLIEEQSLVVNMDYKLIFLEYYEIIICCLHIYYDVCKTKRIFRHLSNNHHNA